MTKKYDTSAWFKNHVATMKKFGEGNDTITIIDWKEPGTTCYYVNYIMYKNRLYVYGDIGEAVYCWYDFIDFNFFKKMSIGYFSSKCEASENGKDYMDWDQSSAYEATIEILKEKYEYDKDEKLENLSEEQIKEILDKWLEEKDVYLTFDQIEEACYDKHGWYSFLNEHDEIFGPDFTEYQGGQIISIRCHGHLNGLKMAIQQIEEREKKNVECKND